MLDDEDEEKSEEELLAVRRRTEKIEDVHCAFVHSYPKMQVTNLYWASLKKSHFI